MIAKGCLHSACVVTICCQSLLSHAENVLPLSSNANASLNFSSNNSPANSIAENIYAMDKDGDGMVSVVEVRAFIESRHGKTYQKDVLDEMESSINGKSCSTPFAKPTF